MGRRPTKPLLTGFPAAEVDFKCDDPDVSFASCEGLKPGTYKIPYQMTRPSLAPSSLGQA